MFTPVLEDVAGAGPVVYAFPHAGGNLTGLAPLARALPVGCALRCVDLPGRLARAHEPARTEFLPLVRDLADAVAAEVSRTPARPFALLGSCGGAYLALEIARALRADLVRPPAVLAVLSAAAPDVAPIPHRVAELPATTLWEYLRGGDGVPDELPDDPVFLGLAERAVRADFALFADYRHRPAPPLDVPVVALRGAEDRGLRRGELLGWRRQTTRPAQTDDVAATGRWLVEHAPDAVAAALRDWLT
ncbi:hypothetical protein BLA60_04780 [Actinophytocola xinjiangensis]|uniref:Thioesterase domain-containing protein n=1 Tax=Actinophytocola xinjiangensis TaxID=485602 RepID=A0A7Z0WUN2_9PSEU|nr:thioesterase domain-containing protein [Actinophytocola xinjiangensis]OLF14436.1 hypothetical protein BLA60_04780 [Actinophytocola xinjiangensis]